MANVPLDAEGWQKNNMPFWYEGLFWLKFVSIPKYTLKFFVRYGNKINAGQYARGRLTPRYLTAYFKTLHVDSRNCIMNTGIGFHQCLYEDYPHFHVTRMYWIISKHCHNNRKFAARFQLTKLWGKTSTRMGGLPQAAVGVLPEGILFFFWNMYKDSDSYQ